MGHEAIGVVEAVYDGQLADDLEDADVLLIGVSRTSKTPTSLFVLPVGSDDALMPSLLTLSDVMGTGHRAARMALVDRGKKVAVVGDGAVGLC
jgi:Kinase/pyrophosphorylase